MPLKNNRKTAGNVNWPIVDLATSQYLVYQDTEFYSQEGFIMDQPTAFTLTNPANGNLAFKLLHFDDNSYFDHIQRNNYYSLIWVRRGEGIARADFSAYEFRAESLFAFSPYQPFMLETKTAPGGIALHFHPDFFCIHKHQKEVACHGVLFNNIYQAPFVSVREDAASVLSQLVDQMECEIQKPGLAQHDLLVSYLKIFLITASRLRAEKRSLLPETTGHLRVPVLLQHLREAIERDFRTTHAPGDYASRLNISLKALAKMTKNYFNKTMTELIAERIVIEAKRELYLTNKTIKEIAYELGYDDEYYFSRFFKANTEISPQMYRHNVGAARDVA